MSMRRQAQITAGKLLLNEMLLCGTKRGFAA